MIVKIINYMRSAVILLLYFLVCNVSSSSRSTYQLKLEWVRRRKAAKMKAMKDKQIKSLKSKLRSTKMRLEIISNEEEKKKMLMKAGKGVRKGN